MAHDSTCPPYLFFSAYSPNNNNQVRTLYLHSSVKHKQTQVHNSTHDSVSISKLCIFALLAWFQIQRNRNTNIFHASYPLAFHGVDFIMKLSIENLTLLTLKDISYLWKQGNTFRRSSWRFLLSRSKVNSNFRIFWGFLQKNNNSNIGVVYINYKYRQTSNTFRKPQILRK